MLLALVIYFFIAYIPYLAAYIGLGIEWIQLRKVFNRAILYFAGFGIIKIFYVAIVSPAVEGHIVQTFIVNMLLTSFEFIAFQQALSTKFQKGSKIITYFWSLFSVISISFFPILSNSRSYEIELNHLLYAFCAIQYLFQWGAARNIVRSIGTRANFFRSNIPNFAQLLILLLGLPNAFGSLDRFSVMPSYMPNVLRIGSSVMLYLFSTLLPTFKAKKNN